MSSTRSFLTLLLYLSTFPSTVIQGIQYHYTLREEVQGQQAVDSPEWVLPLPILEQLSARENLQLVLKLNFHEYYLSKIRGAAIASHISYMSIAHECFEGPPTLPVAAVFVAMQVQNTKAVEFVL